MLFSLDERKKRKGFKMDRPKIELDAVLDTDCRKCGGHGNYFIFENMLWWFLSQKVNLKKKKIRETEEKLIPLTHIYMTAHSWIDGARVAQWIRSLDLTAHTILSPIWRGFAPSFVNYKKGCTRLTSASDKVYQLLAQGWWFCLGTPAFSTTKTGCHYIAEILPKVALKHQKINQ